MRVSPPIRHFRHHKSQSSSRKIIQELTKEKWLFKRLSPYSLNPFRIYPRRRLDLNLINPGCQPTKNWEKGRLDGLATYLLLGGTPVEVVSKHLGHARTSITMDVYSHATEEDRSEAIKAGASGYAKRGRHTGNVVSLRRARSS